MKSRVQKWGNSLAVRIPKTYAEEAGLTQDAAVELSVRDGALTVALLPASPPALDELLSRVTKDNLNREPDAGPPAGKESW